MKTKIAIIFLVVIIAIVAFFVFLNPVKVPVYIWPDYKYELPLSFVILGGISFGFLVMLIISIFREIKLSFENRKIRKILMKKEKGLEFLKEGIINFFYGNYKDSIKNLKSALKQDSTNFAYNIFLHDFSKEKNAKENAITGMPVEIAKFYFLKLYYENSQYDNIINASQELIEDKNFKNKDILSIIRDSFEKTGRFNEAISIQEKILTLKNIDKNAEQEILKRLYYLKLKAEKLLENLNNFIKKYNTYAPFYFLKYQLVYEKDKTKSIEILKEGYRNTRNNLFLAKLLEIFYENDMLEDVKKEIKKVFLKFRSEKIVEILYAFLEFSDNKIEDAKKIINKYPQNRLAMFIKAEIMYRENHEFQERAELYRKAFGIEDGKIFNIICKSCNNHLEQVSIECNKCGEINNIEAEFIFNNL